MTDINAAFAARLVLFAVVFGTIGCDRVTKHVATAALAGTPDRSYLADTVRLGYIENPGGFLSLGATLPSGPRTILFTGATGLMLAAATVFAIARRHDKWTVLGLALFISGGLSNWIDRFLWGSVVDFLNVGIGPVRTGVFNIADVAIMIGACIFVFGEIRRAPEHASRPADSDGS